MPRNTFSIYCFILHTALGLFHILFIYLRKENNPRQTTRNEPQKHTRESLTFSIWNKSMCYARMKTFFLSSERLSLKQCRVAFHVSFDKMCVRKKVSSETAYTNCEQSMLVEVVKIILE